MIDLIERIILKKVRLQPKNRSIFDLHHEHHRRAKVDLTSFQAKNLGISYFGFGRYGKFGPPPQTLMTEAISSSKSKKKFTITHVVKNGLLSQTAVHPPENAFYPSRDQTDFSAYFEKQGKSIKKQIEELPPRDKSIFNRGMKVLNHFIEQGGYETINRVLFSALVKNAHPTLINKITCMDKLFDLELTKLKQDIPVYTATAIKIKKVGESLVFKGFLSATVEPRLAIGMNADDDVDMQIPAEDEDDMDTKTLIQIDLKRGQRVLDVTSLSGGPGYVEKNGEDEFVFPRESHLIITDGPIYLKHSTVWRAELDQKDEDFMLDPNLNNTNL